MSFFPSTQHHPQAERRPMQVQPADQLALRPRNPRIAVSKLLEGIASPTLSECAKIWRDTLSRYANSQKAFSQDSDSWEFLKHLTISRDRTANSNYANEQLAVLITSPLNAHEKITQESPQNESIALTKKSGADQKHSTRWNREKLLNILDDFPSWELESEVEEDDDEDNNETLSESELSGVEPWNIDTDLYALSRKLRNVGSESDIPSFRVVLSDIDSGASTVASTESDSDSVRSYTTRGLPPLKTDDMDTSSERDDGDDALILRKLLDQMENLRAENRRLKDRLVEVERSAPKMEQELPPTFQTFHRLSPSEISLYPPTRMAGENDIDESVLRLDVTIASLDRYLEKHPEIVFAVFKDYQRKVKNDITKSSKDGNETQAETLAPLEPFKESIRLTSEGMKEAFKACMVLWPEFSSTLFPNFDINAEIPAPYMFWHHYQSSYASIVPQLSENHRHLMDRLTQWIQDHYSEEYNRANTSLSKGLVSYKTMPYLVRPGDVLVSKDTSGALNGYMAKAWVRPLADTVSHAATDGRKQTESTNQTSDSKRGQKEVTSIKYEVKCWAWEYNGSFNSKTRTISICLEYKEPGDETEITSLDAYPLRYAKESVQDSLRRRGEMYWSCRFQKLVEYHEINQQSLATVIERYMVDYATYKKLHRQPEQGVLVNAGESYKLSEDQGPQGDEIYLFPPKVTCYSLVRKSWVDLPIDRMYNVQWDKAAFDNLVIDRDTKELILALVMNQLEAERATDIISGKGNGLIMLLHGGPGTGKTFTAEAVAEIAEKPLYRVTCGDVGTKPEAVERYLESVLHLGKIWGCVVLLDEADVFLEERTLSQLERNALVSVFLRVLEYYEGILILTSNRVGTFDEAFKSRIQLALHYKNLSDTQRRRVWWNFLNRLQNMERGDDPTTIDFDDLFDHIDELATKYVMNGRQIRNVITTARQLAKHRKKVMTFSDLHHVIEVSSRFDKYLQDVREGLTDDEVARSYGKR